MGTTFTCNHSKFSKTFRQDCSLHSACSSRHWQTSLCTGPCKAGRKRIHVQTQVALDAQQSSHRYSDLLQKGKHWTLDAPEGQLLGRAGRRCVLEDGERALLTCMGMRPEALSPRILLMTNLVLQNRGREREVPVLAIQTLKKTRLHKCSSECAAEDVESSVHVVELGLRALKKAGREHSMRRFVQDAAAAMPALAADFETIASRRFHVDLNASVKPSCRQFQDFLTSEDNDDQ
ncbi:TPA: hypothetical protein ACH3X2_008679 [Trebouxia sp. C0005]